MPSLNINILPNQSFPEAKRHAARQWPRVTVGLFALWGLYGGISTLWLGLRLNQSLQADKKVSHPLGPTGFGPEEEDRVIKMTLITIGVLSVLVNGTELFASIRKSVWATKAALGFWIIQIGWFLLGTILFIIALMSMSDRDREQLPKLTSWEKIQSVLSLVLTLFNGWALLVFLRDLKHRQRNAWGKLVRTEGVFEYEPIAGEGQVFL